MIVKNLVSIGLVAIILLGSTSNTQVAKGRDFSPVIEELSSFLSTQSGYHSEASLGILELTWAETIENDDLKRTEEQQGFQIVPEKAWLTEEDIPWSKPVWVKVNEEEKYLAVIDREYSAGVRLDDIKRPGIVSNWSRQWLRIFGYMTHQTCVTVIFVPICNTQHHPVEVGSVKLKVGDRILQPQGANSLFRIEDNMARALYQASQNDETVLVQVIIPSIGDKVTRPIGQETIKAWRFVYKDAPQTATDEIPSASSNIRASLSSDAQTLSSIKSELGTLPTVKEAQWRIDHKIPWSVPVLVEDEFEGNYVAVLDHDVRERFGRDKRPGLVTNWSRNRLQVYSYLLQTGSWQSFPIQQIVLQIGEQTFMLEGNNNEFVIQPTLALALRDAPLGQVSLSYFNLKGDKLTHPIGDKTVESWHILYRSVFTSTEQP